MMIYIRFYFFWILANLVGFVVGSYLGATNDGLTPAAIPGYPGLILGDLTFGATFGLAQWLVFHFTNFMRISPWWIGLTGLGFTLGARSGSLLTYRLIELHALLEPSVVFGIIMGGCIGITTYFAFQHNSIRKTLFDWLVICTLAWILGESIAFNSNFIQGTVPLVALVISSITGLGLIRIQYLSSVRNKESDIGISSSTP